MIICLGLALLQSSSHLSGTDGPPMCPRSRCCSRWGLQSAPCRQGTGELLPRLSILAIRCPKAAEAVYFCCTFLEVASTGSYPAPLPCGARTFLAHGLSAPVSATIRPAHASCPSHDTGFMPTCKHPFPPPSGQAVREMPRKFCLQARRRTGVPRKNGRRRR